MNQWSEEAFRHDLCKDILECLQEVPEGIIKIARAHSTDDVLLSHVCHKLCLNAKDSLVRECFKESLEVV